MTIKEKRKAIEKYCESSPDRECSKCPLGKTDNARYGCYSTEHDDMIVQNYEILFGNVEAEDVVNRPSHYTDGKIEVIDYIEDKKLGFCLGNAIKYISRAGKKDPTKEVEDLNKAIWYVKRRIKEIEEGIA